MPMTWKYALGALWRKNGVVVYFLALIADFEFAGAFHRRQHHHYGHRRSFSSCLLQYYEMRQWKPGVNS